MSSKLLSGGFAGTLNYTMDAKGRLVIPSTFRRRLGSRFVVTRGAEGALLLMTEQRWQDLADRHAGDPDFVALFVSGAALVTPDRSTGRIGLPHTLRAWAGLRPGQEVALAGVGHAVAISPSDRWDSLLRATETRLVQALIGGPVRELPALWTERLPGGPLVRVAA